MSEQPKDIPKFVGLNFKGEEELFPQIWINKKSGELAWVMPWMEIIKGQEILAVNIPDDKTQVRSVFGALAQVGWLVENGHGVFFGIGLQAEELFEKVGEY